MEPELIGSEKYCDSIEDISATTLSIFNFIGLKWRPRLQLTEIHDVLTLYVDIVRSVPQKK